MPYPFRVQEILKCIDGHIIYGDGSRQFSTYSIDSRQVTENSIFVPLVGTRNDGHTFILEALQRGASCALVREKHPKIPEILSALFQPLGSNLPEQIKETTLIEVRHTLVALQKLASWFRKRFEKVKVFAVTGSVGKTQTKEMAASLLSKKYAVVKTEKNFNNEIGVPLTLGKLDPNSEVAVLEMAMRGRAEISLLSRIAEPNFALITNTHLSHIGRLGSAAEIAKAKAEIVDGMKQGGVLWLNAGDPNLKVITEEIKRKLPEKYLEMKFFDVSKVNGGYLKFGTPKKTSAGKSEDASAPKPNLWVEDVEIRGLEGSCFAITDGREKWQVSLDIIGSSAVKNFVCACAIATELGVSLEECSILAKSLRPTPQRLRAYRLNKDTFLIDDTYNSAPASCREAAEVLACLPKEWRRVIVLGDMLELGKYEAQLHREVANLFYGLPPSKIICVGDRTRAFLEVPKPEGFEVTHFPSLYAPTPSGNIASQAGNIASYEQPLATEPSPTASEEAPIIVDDETIAKITSLILEEIGKSRGKLALLIKGSRALKLERIVAGVLAEFGLEEEIL